MSGQSKVKRNRIGKFIFLLMLIFILVLGGCNNQNNNSGNADRNENTAPKYVFLFIGDGMGAVHINAAELYFDHENGNSNSGDSQRLAFSKFPVLGTISTNTSDNKTTDSAAAATAIASGHKTENGRLNMDPEKKVAYTTIAESAKKKGMKVGIVTNVAINDATPAGFYAHQSSRTNYYEIAADLIGSGFDYFGGSELNQPAGEKGDKSNIYGEAEKKGYKVAKTKGEIDNLSTDDGKTIALNSSVSLASLTQKGIDLMDNQNGFFIMVEGGKIDRASHVNDTAVALDEIKVFNDAINTALKFYEKHKEETLILVTADHETGGMVLSSEIANNPKMIKALNNQTTTYDKFVKEIKEYRKNTGAKGNVEDILQLVEENYGLAVDSLSSENIAELRNALIQNGQASNEQAKLLYGDYEPVAITAEHILSQKAGASFTTFSHTQAPVPLFALGAGENNFDGAYDNTDIFKKLSAVMGITAEN